MTAYIAPLDDMRFVINEVAGLNEINALPGFQEATTDLVDAVLEEAGRLGSEVLAPLNHTGDRQGARFENGVVRTPDGFADAYKQFTDGGWNAIWAPEEFGGQGLPMLVATAVSEIWHSANMAFALCPMLTQSGIELMLTHADDELRSVYLEKLVSGEWSGTMNLTEPQAGSDLSRIRTIASPNGDGSYRMKGQKIYITYGEHDMAPNIVHLVLARTPDAPPGVRGLSLFVVPKFLVNEDGTPGRRNDVKCLSIEHKLGINGSPTCIMSYGDDEGATAFIVGEEHRGIEYMFTMMNNARLAVGLEGVGIAERAFQQARTYARERVQSRQFGSKNRDAVSIIEHADVKRMLLSMRVQAEASRALAYKVAAALDKANRHPDAEQKAEAQSFVDLLTPVVKAWSTDIGIDVASTGVQVHGGMGYVEETGAAQHYRDARIASIYEGTNGIQANDLVGRKVCLDQGKSIAKLIQDIRGDLQSVTGLPTATNSMDEALAALDAATQWMVETAPTHPDHVAAGAVHYLKLLGRVCGGWLLCVAAARAEASGSSVSGDFKTSKRVSAEFFCHQYLTECPAILRTIRDGAGIIADVASEAI